jgi:nucleoid DNA-binding protein
MKKLNKNEIIDLVAEKNHLSKNDAKAAVDSTFELIMESLLKGDSVNIKNFCVFEPKTKAGRKGTHPKMHTELTIESKKTVTVHLAKEFKARLNEK